MTVPVLQPTTVTLLRAAPAGQDGYGNDTLTFTAVTVPGCVVWPSAASSSDELTAGRDTVITGLTVLAPPGTLVAPADRMQVPGYPETFDVVGQPAAWISPLTGTRPGVQVSLRRVTG